MIDSEVSGIMLKKAAKMSHIRSMVLSVEVARSDACSNVRAVDAARAVGFVKLVICAHSVYFIKLKYCMSVRGGKFTLDCCPYWVNVPGVTQLPLGVNPSLFIWLAWLLTKGLSTSKKAVISCTWRVVRVRSESAVTAW